MWVLQRAPETAEADEQVSMGRVSDRALLGMWLLALAWAAPACSDAVVFSGTYREELPQPDPATGKYGQDFVMGLDLFQFGDEFGGIVRYHSLRQVEGKDDDPFEQPERVCFWTDVTRLESEATRIRLAYTDERDRTTDLELRATDEDGQFIAQRVVFQEAAGADIEQQVLSMRRIEDEDADNRCDRPNEEFRLLVGLDVQSGLQRLGPAELAGNLCEGSTCGEGLTCDVLTGSCMAQAACDAACEEGRVCSPRSRRCESTEPPGKLTATLVWVGQVSAGAISRAEVYTWGYRVADLPHGNRQTQFTLLRNLPPGEWKALPIPFVTSDRARVVMGILLIYRDDDATTDVRGEVTPDWDKSEEPLVGTAFRRISDSRRQGLVVLYIDGDPSTLSPEFLALFRDAQTNPPQAGYGVYELTWDVNDPQTFELSRRQIQAITLYLRDWDLALSAEDIDKNLPRIPNF